MSVRYATSIVNGGLRWGVAFVFWEAIREARGPGGVIANEGEAIQLMFGRFRLCSQTLLLGFRHSLAGLLRKLAMTP